MAVNKNITSYNTLIKILFFILFLLFTVYIFWQSLELGWLDILNNQEKMLFIIKGLGFWGPVAIVFLIAIAIIISPIPSAPIAIISGVLYGHTLGGIYVVLGALTGALTAFFIARKLGRDYVHGKLNSYFTVRMVGSQNVLMLIVFVTRLIPFLSFDVISYAAGLTQLSWLRFFTATLLGIIPVSFLLAHLGSKAVNGEVQSITIAIIVLGLFIMIPIAVNVFKNNMKG